ncbi:DUF3563 family protein [Rhizobium laguerreae]|uniref:DUF3563 family protein n=1 Tax=Rhizobium laguerreae TaxID=1076926 RepID=UPI001C909A23|nr:DUF3563 family protein [Rhizobium laguerreae]MBY3155453.1 DUF3563 family protein [Rhizobium laguerreae]
MRHIIRNITTFLSTDHERRAEESYLNGSVDRIDLEYRQREIDRGVFRKTARRGIGIN